MKRGREMGFYIDADGKEIPIYYRSLLEIDWPFVLWSLFFIVLINGLGLYIWVF